MAHDGIVRHPARHHHAVHNAKSGESPWKTKLSCGQAANHGPTLLHPRTWHLYDAITSEATMTASDEWLGGAETVTGDASRTSLERNAESKFDAVMAGASRRGRAQIGCSCSPKPCEATHTASSRLWIAANRRGERKV